MAEQIRRHPLAFGSLSIVLVTALALLLIWPGPAQVVRAQDRYDPVDRVAFDQIHVLLKDAALDNDALAAANGDDTQLEAALAGLRTYFQNNRSAWLAQAAALADQKNLIELYKSRINNGLDEIQNLNAARATLTTLETQYASSMSSLRQTILSTFSEGQRSLIDQMRLNREVPMPYRVLALSAEQKVNLNKALLKLRQRMAIPTDDATRDQIQRDFDADLENAIGAQKVTTLNTLKNYLPAAAGRVVETQNRVFPVQE